MSHAIGPASSPQRPFKPTGPQAPASPVAAPKPPGRIDTLSLTAMPSPADAVQALLMLKRLGDRPGSALRGSLGETLTPEEALARLADGAEVVARVPAAQGPARSTAALLFSLEDVQTLGARLALV